MSPPTLSILLLPFDFDCCELILIDLLLSATLTIRCTRSSKTLGIKFHKCGCPHSDNRRLRRCSCERTFTVSADVTPAPPLAGCAPVLLTLQVLSNAFRNPSHSSFTSVALITNATTLARHSNASLAGNEYVYVSNASAFSGSVSSSACTTGNS